MPTTLQSSVDCDPMTTLQRLLSVMVAPWTAAFGDIAVIPAPLSRFAQGGFQDTADVPRSSLSVRPLDVRW